MVTSVRLPNKAGWALDEAIQLDGDIAEHIATLLDALEHEREVAKHRYDTKAQLRIADAMTALARMQQATGRLATLHRLARANQYDGREM